MEILESLVKPPFNEELRKVTPEKKAKIEALFADAEFFDWLEETMRKAYSISDKKANGQIYYFYEGIRLWAEKNNVYPFFYLEDGCPIHCFYRVKIGDGKYDIGEYFGYDGETPVFFCRQTGLYAPITAPSIDLDDVIADVTLEKIQSKLAVYRQLAEAIETLKELGLDPYDAQRECESAIVHVYTKDM